MTTKFRLADDGGVQVAAGRYWLGDPCRAFDDATWTALLDARDEGSRIARVGRASMVSFHTAHGDGEYASGAGRIVVDSGTIGLVPAVRGRATPDGMHLVEMHEGDVCSLDDGTIRLGRYVVHTGTTRERAPAAAVAQGDGTAAPAADASPFKVMEDGSVEIEPGFYLVGDPCWAFPDDAENDQWDRLLDSCDSFEKSPVGHVDGIHVVAFQTSNGDGFFESEGCGYAVESGLLGMVRLSGPMDEKDVPEEMQLVEVEEPGWCSNNGRFIVLDGEAIDTDPPEDDDDLEEEDEEPGHSP